MEASGCPGVARCRSRRSSRVVFPWRRHDASRSPADGRPSVCGSELVHGGRLFQDARIPACGGLSPPWRTAEVDLPEGMPASMRMSKKGSHFVSFPREAWRERLACDVGIVRQGADSGKMENFCWFCAFKNVKSKSIKAKIPGGNNPKLVIYLCTKYRREVPPTPQEHPRFRDFRNRSSKLG